MPDLQRDPTSTSVIDVLDHILDKGIVVEPWMRYSVVGIDLLTLEARVVVASIETYLNRADAFAQTTPALASLNLPAVWHHPPTRSPGQRRSVSADLRTRKR
jgi:hypothetical protein